MKLSRKRKLALNTATGLAHQLISIVCAFIVPRLILGRFGSGVNGLVNSITHFLGLISLLESGISQVISSNLYKPLAEDDYPAISKIFKSSQRFFSMIGMIFAVFAVLLAFLYPTVINREFEFSFVFPLVLILAIGSFAQYFIGYPYLIIINADQRLYLSQMMSVVTLILSTVFTALLIRLGYGIHMVRLAAALIYLAQPVCYKAYADRKYHIDHKIRLSGEPIQQKWNGLAQHIAFIVTTRTDLVVLTAFSTLANVSVYSVYNMVLAGLSGLLGAMTGSITPYLGNVLAKGETENLTRSFDYIEWALHTAVTFLYTSAALLIIPFVGVYTIDIYDADYIAPLFAAVLTLAYALRELRTPYSSVIFAAGHFRQTQLSSVLEAAINIVISVAAVAKFGLVGVAVGTACAMMYRTIYLVVYLSRNIMMRRPSCFLKHFAVDVFTVIIAVPLSLMWPRMCIGYFDWVILAVKVCISNIAVVAAVNFAFYRGQLQRTMQLLRWRRL